MFFIRGGLMRVKVELHKDVVRFLNHDCSDEDRRAFQDVLDRVRETPVELSEAIADPNLSRYMLRFFRFAGYLAVFSFDPAVPRIVVRKCQKPSLKLIRLREPLPGRTNS
jgi:hypothetical protein